MNDDFVIPDTTSVSRDEFKPDQYVMPFAPELVDFIRAGRKLTTYRFGNKYDYLQVGDTVGIQDSMSKELVGNAKITAKRSALFKDLPVQTGAHESFRDKEHQRTVLSGYYAYIGRPIADDDIFLIFDFELAR